MSWSVTLIGNPDNIAKALEKESEILSGNSKVEFDAALPHLLGLVKENFNTVQPPVLKIVASGHGYDNYRNCLVHIEHLTGKLV